MTARELFEAIGLVDEDLVADADAPVRRRWTPRLVLRRALPLAACLCLAVGAVMAWRAAPGGGLTAGDAATPQLAAAEDAPETYQAPADGGTNEETAGTAAPEIADSKNSAADHAREETSLVWDAITPAQANGGGASLATGAEELLGDTADPAPTDWPETLPVYRDPLADGGLDESAMRDTLRQVLQAMGRDPHLADDAVLVYNWSQDQIDQADQIAADLQQQFGSASALEFWGGMAQLELTLDDGSSLTVRNSRMVYLSAAENASLRAMTGDDLAANASLLQALGGFDTLRSPVSHSWADGSALNDGPVLTRSDAPGNMTGLQVKQNGSLANWTLSAAASATPVAELPILSLGEAEDLLQNGGYLGVGYEEKEPAQGTIVDARLGYLSGNALYYVPVWQFTVDMGQTDAQYPAADPDTGETLHAYFTYCVPAVDLDTLADLIAADQAG